MHSNGTHLNRARVVFHPNIHYTHPTRGRGVYERFSFEFEHEDEHRGFSSPRCACLLPVNVLRPRFVFPDNTRAPLQYIHIPSYTSPRCSNLHGRLNRDRVSGIGGVECNETLEIRVINARFAHFWNLETKILFCFAVDEDQVFSKGSKDEFTQKYQRFVMLEDLKMIKILTTRRNNEATRWRSISLEIIPDHIPFFLLVESFRKLER